MKGSNPPKFSNQVMCVDVGLQVPLAVGFEYTIASVLLVMEVTSIDTWKMISIASTMMKMAGTCI